MDDPQETQNASGEHPAGEPETATDETPAPVVTAGPAPAGGALAPAGQAGQEPPGKSTMQKAQDTARDVYRLVRMIVLILLGFVIALFVVRNWNRVDFDYVFGDVRLPLAAVMLIFTAIGIAVGMLIYWFLARRSKK
jgi:uncharacterized integral membrane protein